jgi:NAD(P)-dependent dehydrogenase (short-subunit alcohol dehydrogenase family)
MRAWVRRHEVGAGCDADGSARRREAIMVKAVDAVLPTGPRLAGRRVIVTGAASGMGQAIARLFAAEGARLTLLDVQAGPLEAVAQACGGQAVATDIASEAEVARAVEAASAFMGGIDGVVNAAGILRTLPLEQTTPEIWRRIHDVNLFGPYLLSNLALPHLRAAGDATIVNIASMGGIETPPMMASYGASKAGLIGLTQGQALEWAPDIRANAICPGMIATPMTDALSHGGPEGDAASLAGIGAGRKGTPMEVAYLALFLTSRESSFVTGSVYTIHGGRAARHAVSEKPG